MSVAIKEPKTGVAETTPPIRPLRPTDHGCNGSAILYGIIRQYEEYKPFEKRRGVLLIKEDPLNPTGASLLTLTTKLRGMGYRVHSIEVKLYEGEQPRMVSEEEIVRMSESEYTYVKLGLYPDGEHPLTSFELRRVRGNGSTVGPTFLFKYTIKYTPKDNVRGDVRDEVNRFLDVVCKQAFPLYSGLSANYRETPSRF